MLNYLNFCAQWLEIKQNQRGLVWSDLSPKHPAIKTLADKFKLSPERAYECLLRVASGWFLETEEDEVIERELIAQGVISMDG